MHDNLDLNMVRTTALGMFDYSMILEKYKPDAAITVADRYETIGFNIMCIYEDSSYSFTGRGTYWLYR